jgi:DNA-binding transcriptional ArsR family regulator
MMGDLVARRRFSPAYVSIAARILGILSHPTRLELVLTLAQGEATVSELCEHLALPQSNASHHLRILRDVALVRDRREGQFVVYGLRVPTWQAIANDFFDQLLDGADSVTLREISIRRHRSRAAASASGTPHGRGGLI